MFEGMYDLISKAKNARLKRLNERGAVLREAIPILSADDLLSTEKRIQLLDDIKVLLNLPESEYESVFLKAIHHFADFVQNIPETDRSYYALLGGILDHALERVSLSLFLTRTYLIPSDTSAEANTDAHEKMVWVYAVFTASLLLDIGKIPTRHSINLTNKDGQVVCPWEPFAGNMVINPEQDMTHYVFGFVEDHDDILRQKITPLLARQILPVEGFNLLASNKEVLLSWLALLSDDQRNMGSFLSVVKLVDAQLLENYFTDKKIFRHHKVSAQTTAALAKIQKERKEQKEKQQKFNSDKNADKNKEKFQKQALFGFAGTGLGTDDKKHMTTEISAIPDVLERFIQWIQKDPDSKLSQNLIQRINEGVVIDQKVLTQFVNENKSLNLTSQQLSDLLIKSDIVTPVQAIEMGKQTGIFNNALLVTNPYLVFPNGPPPIPSVIQGVMQAQQMQAQEAKIQTPGPTPYTVGGKR